MKVKGISQNPTVMIVFVLVFGAISAFIYYGFWKIYTEDGILDALARAGMPVLFAMFFTAIIFYFFFLLFKPPVWRKAKLVEKRYLGGRGEGTYYLRFRSASIYLPLVCWTSEEYDFQVKREYKILIKEFTNRIYEVDELTGTYSDKKTGTVSIRVVYYGIIIILIGTASFPFLKDIIKISQGNFNLMLIPFYIVILLIIVSSIIGVARLIKQSKKDENPMPKVACGRGPNRGAGSLPAGMGSGERFSIKKVAFEVSIGSVYHVLNANGNKVLEAKLDLSGYGKYAVKNNYDECIATIQHSDSVTTVRQYEVKIGQESPFIVRPMVTIDTGYEITGLDYSVCGNMIHTEFEILDFNENLVAHMSGKPLKDGWVNGNESEVIMAPGVENNIYILFLALTLFIDKESRDN